MRFYTDAECEEWLAGRARQRPDKVLAGVTQRVPFPLKPYQIRFFAHWIAESLTHRLPTLLWITEWDIWPSSENWHLYYRLRQSYADHRLLNEAPGHLFLEHESEDLATFLQLAMLNGWGGYVLTHANYVNAFFSHDEYVDFIAEREDNLAIVREKWCGPATPAAE